MGRLQHGAAARQHGGALSHSRQRAWNPGAGPRNNPAGPAGQSGSPPGAAAGGTAAGGAYRPPPPRGSPGRRPGRRTRTQ